MVNPGRYANCVTKYKVNMENLCDGKADEIDRTKVYGIMKIKKLRRK